MAFSRSHLTRRGRPVLAILTWDLHESLVETLEVLGDPKLLSHLRVAVTQADEGQTVDWERARAEFLE